jgi:hypothetical protein
MTRPVAPPRPAIRKGHCGHGVTTPCGQPARPYLPGWLCDTHRPHARPKGDHR